MKYLKHVVSAIIALSISSVTLANEIKMGKADWDTGYFQAEISEEPTKSFTRARLSIITFDANFLATEVESFKKLLAKPPHLARPASLPSTLTTILE